MKTNISFFNAITRQQALDDGSLIDVSTIAYEVGFSVPVAISKNAWHKVMNTLTTEQQKNERIKTLLQMLFSRIHTISIVLVNPPNTHDFSVPASSVRGRAIKLKSITGTGDVDTSAITIILSTENKD